MASAQMFKTMMWVAIPCAALQTMTIKENGHYEKMQTAGFYFENPDQPECLGGVQFINSYWKCKEAAVSLGLDPSGLTHDCNCLHLRPAGCWWHEGFGLRWNSYTNPFGGGEPCKKFRSPTTPSSEQIKCICEAPPTPGPTPRPTPTPTPSPTPAPTPTPPTPTPPTPTPPTPVPPTPVPPTPAPTTPAPTCPDQVVVDGGDVMAIEAADHFYVSSSCSCPEGEEIVDPADCAAAACSLGQAWNVMKSSNSWKLHAKGCAKRNGPLDFGLYFNEHSTGGCSNWAKAVCVRT